MEVEWLGGRNQCLAAMRALISISLVVLASGCSTVHGVKDAVQGAIADVRGTPVQVLLVDARGTPVQGAFVLPEYENPLSAPQKYDDDEIKAHTSDEQGSVLVMLDDYYWDSDHCYHFRVRRNGFEDVTMAVSKDLYPAVLKIELDATPRAPRKAPAAAPSGR
jgi:hypothetical protein